MFHTSWETVKGRKFLLNEQNVLGSTCIAKGLLTVLLYIPVSITRVFCELVTESQSNDFISICVLITNRQNTFPESTFFKMYDQGMHKVLFHLRRKQPTSAIHHFAIYVDQIKHLWQRLGSNWMKSSWHLNDKNSFHSEISSIRHAHMNLFEKIPAIFTHFTVVEYLFIKAY